MKVGEGARAPKVEQRTVEVDLAVGLNGGAVPVDDTSRGAVAVRVREVSGIGEERAEKKGGPVSACRAGHEETS